MSVIRLVFKSFMCIPSLVATQGSSQEAQLIINQYKTGALPIEAAEIPLLLPFATEWDRVARMTEPSSGAVQLGQYQALSIPSDDRLKEAMSALSNNAHAIEFFTNEQTIAAFNQAYEAAQNDGSPVGMIPHDQALRFWMTSRAITAGPEAIAAFPRNGPSAQWCLPPLILCTPPTPVPSED
ncbi:hypothetical protein [Cognatiyoonia sp. IB215182]|uniref:hypothetical protein n=1 Tax=Cognatiyoonia sp. IB215182 TaxID=3097353 RepID=UPI002A17A863|nr:hypothetical protein [Cognatiyoonia sp. IB215182]MDX8353961.1 hypothetical protein [Cognatiyoonia sp. IB215182]